MGLAYWSDVEPNWNTESVVYRLIVVPSSERLHGWEILDVLTDTHAIVMHANWSVDLSVVIIDRVRTIYNHAILI